MKLITQIIFIAGAIAIFVWYINPTYADIQQKQSDYKKLEEANGKAMALKIKREKLTQQRNKITPIELERLSKSLPDGVENIRLIIDIEAISRKVLSQDIKGAKISGSADKKTASSGQVVTGVDGKRYGTIAVSFGVTTTYDQFIVFLQSLEDNLRLVDVSDISFSAADDDKYSFNLTLQTYWLK
jgi:hypothetical protein